MQEVECIPTARTAPPSSRQSTAGTAHAAHVASRARCGSRLCDRRQQPEDTRLPRATGRNSSDSRLTATAARGMATTILAVLLLLFHSITAYTDPIIIKNFQFLELGKNEKEAVLSCNLTDSPSLIEGRVWKKDGVEIPTTRDSKSSALMEYKLDAVDAKYSGEYTCQYFTIPAVNDTILVKALPGVSVEKKSEHGNEGDYGVLTCRSTGFPAVENWSWSRQTKAGTELIVNGTKNFHIKNMGNKTELRIYHLDIEEDQGDYTCNATNEMGAEVEIIHFRVRGRYAAVWPFLGIVAEVIVLVAIIFIYEKRRKPDEISDDDEQGSAPLKSNSSTNHKDKNIRQRNSN